MAESFGTDPARYDRTRPRYPDALIRQIVEHSPGRHVLDVGVGTGIVSRQLRAAGCRVVGIDVDERMAAFARAAGLEAEVARFEDWDPAGRSFDAVVAGQTWHWIDPAAGVAKAAEVLRPSGLLVAFWNAGTPGPPDLADAFAEAYRRAVPDSLPARAPAGSAADGYARLGLQAAAGWTSAGFGEPQVWRFEWEQTYTRDEWLDQVPTSGVASQFAPAELAQVLEGIGTAIDDVGGSFPMHYTTVAIAAARSGSPRATDAPPR